MFYVFLPQLRLLQVLGLLWSLVELLLAVLPPLELLEPLVLSR